MAATAAIRSLMRTIRSQGDEGTLLAAVAEGDQNAFAELVRRYGPLTLGVCRRVLGSTADADDAFQLAFISLYRSAAAIRDPAALPGWLHRTALRSARKIKSRTQPVAPIAEPSDNPDPSADVSWKEVRAILDEELNALPALLRGPLVLCYLEGRNRDEAAASLAVSRSTLKRRLADGLDRLRRRLTNRGVAALGLASAVLGENGLAAQVPTALSNRVVEACVQLPASASIAGVLSILKTWRAAACFLLGGLIAGGVLVAQTGPVPAPPAKADKPEKSESPKPGFDLSNDPLPDGALARLGTSRLRGKRLTFSPDSKRVVRETAGGDLQLYEVPSGEFSVKLRASDVPERTQIIGSTIGFSPDPKMLAAVLWKGRAGIWDTATGKLIRWIESGKFYSIVQCDFSPDGKLLAIGGNDDPKETDDEKIRVGVYEVATGKQLFAETGSTSRFSDDGKRLFVWNGYGAAPEKKHLRTVSITDPEERTALLHHSEAPNWRDPITDGQSALLELLKSGTVQIRDLKTGDVKQTLGGATRSENVRVSLSHTRGRRELIVVQTEPPALWCWNIDTGKQLWKREVPTPPNSVDLSGDGKTLVTCGKEGEVLTIDALTGKDRAIIPVRSVGHSTGLMQISPDGKVVATFTASPEPGGSSVLFWDAFTGKRLTDLPGHSALITDALFTSDGSKILTAGRDNTLRTWDAVSGREMANVPLAAPGQLAQSPDGRRLYASDPKGGTIRVVDPGTGRVQTTFAAFKKSVIGFTLTGDGKRLIAAGRDADEAGIVRFLNAATGEQIREFPTREYRIEQMAASSDGSVIATACAGARGENSPSGPPTANCFWNRREPANGCRRGRIARRII